MLNVPSVNLNYIDSMKQGSADDLAKLPQFANGPLRLHKRVKKNETTICLGVRTWSTYFFEKLIATPKQIADAKIKTQVAIEEHARKLLNNDTTMLLGHDPEELTATLQLMVLKKKVKPQPIVGAATDKDSQVDKRQGDSPPKYSSARRKMFHGATTVPTGVSMAEVSPLKVIANVRLVTKANYEEHEKQLSTSLRKGETIRQAAIQNLSNPDSEYFKKEYLQRLNDNADLIQTSVVLEAQADSTSTCSDANLKGAREAAEQFVQEQRGKNKHVSVMVTVPECPPLPNPRNQIATEKNAVAKEGSCATGKGADSDDNLIDGSV